MFAANYRGKCLRARPWHGRAVATRAGNYQCSRREVHRAKPVATFRDERMKPEHVRNYHLTQNYRTRTTISHRPTFRPTAKGGFRRLELGRPPARWNLFLHNGSWDFAQRHGKNLRAHQRKLLQSASRSPTFQLSNEPDGLAARLDPHKETLQCSSLMPKPAASKSTARPLT